MGSRQRQVAFFSLFPADFDFGDEESWNETSQVEEADTTLTETPGQTGNQATGNKAANNPALTKSKGRLKIILFCPVSILSCQLYF